MDSVPEVVQVVFGKSLILKQLGPVHWYSREKNWPGPQLVKVPVTVVAMILRMSSLYVKGREVGLLTVSDQARGEPLVKVPVPHARDTQP